MKTRNSAFLLLTLTLALGGCGGPDAHQADPPAAADPAPVDPAAATTEVVWEKDGLTLSALRGTPQFPGAALSLAGLEEGARRDPGTLKFDFTASGYELGSQTAGAEANGLANSAQGQHIHLILNNGPYSAHYTDKFSQDLETGHYVALAFLSRSWHESVKTPGAAVLTQFVIGDIEVGNKFDLSGQHLFYSRPKGAYTGADTEKLMLDFYLHNTEISPDGNRVRATINGTEFVLTEWVPYVIEGLELGTVTIQLELIDQEGDPVPGPYNNVTRTVKLEPADPPAAQ